MRSLGTLLKVVQLWVGIKKSSIGRHSCMLAKDLRTAGMQKMHFLSSLLLDLGKSFDERYLQIGIRSIYEEVDEKDLCIHNALRDTLFILKIEHEGFCSIFSHRFRLFLGSD